MVLLINYILPNSHSTPADYLQHSNILWLTDWKSPVYCPPVCQTHSSRTTALIIWEVLFLQTKQCVQQYVEVAFLTKGFLPLSPPLVLPLANWKDVSERGGSNLPCSSRKLYGILHISNRAFKRQGDFIIVLTPGKSFLTDKNGIESCFGNSLL